MILVMGMKGNEVARMMHISPAAVSKRYNDMLNTTVRPYFLEYYTRETGWAEPVASLSLAEECSFSLNADYAAPGASRDEERTGFFGLRRSRPAPPPYTARITPAEISYLRDNEVFVFGSDLSGIHTGGAAYLALRRFGARMGQGTGMQGNSYAIPTIVGGLRHVVPYVRDFFQFAALHPEKVFLVTPVGCGIAGFTPADIAPLFEPAREIPNVHLPQSFWEVLR